MPSSLTELSLDELQRLAERAIRQFVQGGLQPHEATATLRSVAELFVAMRGHFFTKEGHTDWGGKTGAYRACVNETFQRAEVPGADLTRLQNAIRYHIGNALRDQLSADELASIGLRPVSPRERSVEGRAGRSAMLALVGAGGGGMIRSPEDIATALRTVEFVLRRVDQGSVRALSAAERADLRRVLVAIRRDLRGVEHAAAADGALVAPTESPRE